MKSEKQVTQLYNSLSKIYWIISIIDNIPKFRGIEFVEPHENEVVLCIGFGLGEELEKFKKHKCNTFGIELSENMIKKAKQRGLDNLIRGDALKLPFRNNTFNIVYSCYVMDLIDDREIQPLLKEIKRILKHDGKIISVNNIFEKGPLSRMLVNLYLLIKDKIYTRLKTRPINTPRLLHKANFKEIAKKKVGWATEAVRAKKI